MTRTERRRLGEAMKDHVRAALAAAGKPVGPIAVAIATRVFLARLEAGDSAAAAALTACATNGGRDVAVET
ncbi:MAG: hypothetical protein U1E66_08110 [Rhodospirillales bacterium]